MIFILHRYIFRDLFRAFVLAVVGLTLILILGSIFLPVQEYGLGPRQALHLMGYFLPIILTFVLPISALFAGALVYGRFASDNELDACKASGISLLTLVYPGLALAIMVAIANLVLSFYITPFFVQQAEKSLKADAKQILFRNLKRKGYYKLPQDQRCIIYADYADPQNDMLLGVVVTEMKNGRLAKISAVDSATVKFNPHEKFNEVKITARNPYHIGAEDNLWFSSEWMSFTVEFGSLLGDDVKFKKINEMKKIQGDPVLFDPIAKLANSAYAQFATDLLAQDIKANVAKDANSYYSLHSGDKFVEFTAGDCGVKGNREVELFEDVVVIESNVVMESGKLIKKPFRTLRCAKALLRIEGKDTVPVSTVTMELDNPAWQRTDGQKGTVVGRIQISGLIPPKSTDIRETFGTEHPLEAVFKAFQSPRLLNSQSKELIELKDELQRKIQQTLAEIAAEIHSRLVFGIGCVPMILIGIGLGVMKRGGHLLSAFAVSCVPAALLIVAIISGKNIIENLGSQSISGLVLMWAGLGFLSILALAVFSRLMRC
jgi:lipopolysaccharide export LptBFGC system permease protein LptF